MFSRKETGEAKCMEEENAEGNSVWSRCQKLKLEDLEKIDE